MKVFERLPLRTCMPVQFLRTSGRPQKPSKAEKEALMNSTIMSTEFWSALLTRLKSDTQVSVPLLLSLSAGFLAFMAAIIGTLRGLQPLWRTNSDRRQITESVAEAREELGSKELHVRLNGIYALERIARRIKTENWSIIAILTAFVREGASVKGENATLAKIDQNGDAQQPHTRPAEDIIAALTAIIHLCHEARTSSHEISEVGSLDLSLTNLRGADLRGARLVGADFVAAHLEGANLVKAHLVKANLGEAHLDGADLRHVRLEGADLTDAYLVGANLTDAYLDGARLTAAHLEGADLTRAYLERANLARAHLEEAILTGADLERAILVEAHLEGAILVEAHLGGAHLWHAHLEGTVFEKAQGLSQRQLDEAFGNAETKLPEGLIRPAHWPQ
jgi:uncharacterized protein YjbI with pentapeptide repeats